MTLCCFDFWGGIGMGWGWGVWVDTLGSGIFSPGVLRLLWIGVGDGDLPRPAFSLLFHFYY